MTQNDFFNILMDGLKDIPEKELRDIISYYDDKFSLGLAAGKTESEIIIELGHPNLIVQKYRDESFNFSQDSDNNVNKINNNKTDSFIKIQPASKKEDSENLKRLNDFTQSNAKIDSEFKNTHSKNRSNEKYSYYEDNSKNSYNNFEANNLNDKTSQLKVNRVLKVCIAILALIIFSPFVTGIIGIVMGILGAAIGLFAASIGVLIGGTFTSLLGLPHLPAFVANFPYPVIVLFSLGSISSSMLLLLLFYYLCKLFVKLLMKIYKSLKPIWR